MARAAPPDRPVVPVREEARGAPDEISRRRALRLMGASSLLALGIPGCDRKPYRKIVSMAETPEYRRPGVPLHYASTWTDGRIPYGIMVRTVDGRPVKVEGLPAHPLNRGTSSAAMQASILSLYDPDRLREPRDGGKPTEWAAVDEKVVTALRSAKSVVLVTRSSLGPAARELVKRFLAAVPAARHVVHEAIHDGPRRRAWKDIHGSEGEVRPRLEAARSILSLDADFLGTDGDVLGATRAFADGRRIAAQDPARASSSRLWVVESGMTVTGSNADHRIPLAPSAMLPLVRALRGAVLGNVEGLRRLAADRGLDAGTLEALVKDLTASRGGGVVLAGPHLPEAVHAGVALLNAEIGATGRTLDWNPEPPTLPVDGATALVEALGREGGVDVLICLGVNPAHDLPGAFEKLVGNVKLSVAHGLQLDETLVASTLALPSAHSLESWDDAAPLPGVRTLCQPVIAPLFRSRQALESLLAWTRALAPDDADLKASADWHDWVQRRWLAGPLAAAGDGAQKAWEAALQSGVVGAPKEVPFPETDRAAAEKLVSSAAPAGGEGLELVVSSHPAIDDGRFASISWLQELPDPVTKLVWDNAALVGPETAGRLGLQNDDHVEVDRPGGRGKVILPVLVQAGVAPGVIATTLGHGRRRAGQAGTGRGTNTAPLLGPAAPGTTPWCSGGVTARKLDAAAKKSLGLEDFRLVRTQKAFSQEGRPLVRHGTLEEYRKHPDFAHAGSHGPKDVQLHAEWDYSQGHKWGMAIDLGACTGCGACTVACQAENNIPVVGKEECGLGREMSWIRIDRYDEGDPANPDVHQQPMLCQHCDNAPCESVCPVNATAHSPEGLNEQVYNRCVGTRYCANNCPYKVRRFNYYDYQGRTLRDPVQELGQNPQVTVRSRGVMEKCTFCVQRINEVKFRLRKDGERDIPDGAIQPACAQACPAKAIEFGDLSDKESRVAKANASPLAYFVLEELNVRPNVAYLARVRNPHPDVAPPPAKPAEEGGHG